MKAGWIILVFLLPLLGSAQIVNIENKRIYDDTAGLSGSVDAGFSAVQNDQLFFSTNLRARAQYKTRKHYYLLLSDIVYSAGQEEVYANSGMIHFRYNYRIYHSPLKWEGYTQVQYNQLLDQRIRALAGAGLRWKFIDTNNIRFFAGTSTFFEHEELQTSGIVNEGFRWSNYLSWFITTKKGFSFTAATYYQPLWTNFKDYRVSGQYTLNFLVTKRLALKFEYNVFHDTRPPVNVRKTVFSSTAGLSLKLGE